MRIHRKLVLGAALLALVAAACTPGGDSATPDADLPAVTVGSAAFYESAVVAEMYAQVLESRGFEVSRQLEMGARDVTHAAITSGQINLMPEYIGSYLGQTFGGSPTSDTAATLEALRTELEAEDLVALEPTPGTDADGFVVRQETADEHSLSSMSDLAAVADQLVWGVAPECEENPLCGPGLEEVYGIDFGALTIENLAPCSPAMAEALNAGAIDVAQVCTTQPEIERFNFVLLEDDQGLAPAQNMVPVLTAELAEAGGSELAEALNAVSAELTTEDLTALGVLVSLEQQNVADVARQWLEDRGLL